MLPGGLIFPLDPGFSSSKGFGTYLSRSHAELAANSRGAANLGPIKNLYFSKYFSFKFSGIYTSDAMQILFNMVDQTWYFPT